ncbi:MAG: polysaccharide deacetylase family protein [Clostridiales bacterium]|nr:polysaccharide deacetylase family protein [Clostridiales bacterium]
MIRLKRRSGGNLLLFVLLLAAAACLTVWSGFYWPSVTTSVSTIRSKEIPIYCVQTEEKKVALSFDAAWGNEDTGTILDILKEEDVHVTFFMTGGWVESFPEDVKAIAAAGHDLGNHSESHYEMSTLSEEQMKDEILTVHNRVKELTGIEMKLFRPPYGDYNDTLVQTVKACGYSCIQWDVDSLDWKDYGADSIISTVCQHKHLGNGSIILMHNGAKYTPQALKAVITGLKEQGYEIVPISQLIYPGEDYTIDHEGRQIPCPS